MDPLKTLGSYAGAMGNAQFMPSSYRKYAVDAQDDKKRDLWSDWGDVFASIANYFREHGWETGGPVLAEVELDPDPTFVIDTRNLTPNETIQSLAAQGVVTRIDAPPTTPAMLISAEQSDGPAYRVGFNNFEVITRYNRSPRYAMAVHDLAEAIAARVHAMPESATPTAVAPAPVAPAVLPVAAPEDRTSPLPASEPSASPAVEPATPATEAPAGAPPDTQPSPPQPSQSAQSPSPPEGKP